MKKLTTHSKVEGIDLIWDCNLN